MRYDAVQFLQSLFRPATVTDSPDLTPADLPTDWFVIWDERAAIMEYDGGLHREHAEHLALLDALAQLRLAGL